MTKKLKDLTQEEKELKRLGGKISSGYDTLQEQIESINFYYSPFFARLGLTHPSDLPTVIHVLYKGSSFLKVAFIERTMEKIEAGIMKNPFKPLRRKALPRDDKNHHEGKNISEGAENAENGPQEQDNSSNHNNPQTEKYLSPEEQKEKERAREKRELHRRLTFFYNSTMKEMGYIRDCYYNRVAISHSQPVLRLNEKGKLEIDTEAFKAFYLDYIKADESVIKQQHQAAADAINRFFNGAVPITYKELERYFILEDGIMKINPSSVSLESYSRLGGRTVKVIKDDDEE